MSNSSGNDYMKNKNIWATIATIATIVTTITSVVTLIPAFGQWLYPREPIQSQPSVSENGDQIASPSKITIEVPSTTEWQNTNIQLNNGDTFSITAEGEWSHGYQGDTNTTPFYGADGYEKTDKTVLLPSSKVGSLIGKIGNGTIFFVGSGDNFTATGSGVLYLGINETHGNYENNSGALTVTIVTTRSP